MEVSAGAGMEGLAFIPVDSEFAWLLASSQENGDIYCFPFDFSVELPTFLDPVYRFTPDPSHTDLAALAYYPAKKSLWVLYDKADKILELRPTSNFTRTEPPIWEPTLLIIDVPGTSQEGLSFVYNSTDIAHKVILGEDRSDSEQKQLMLYDWPANLEK
jgi:hypothetical protein